LKRLLLLRHAKSSWEDRELADHDRPLAPRGRRAAKRMARHLRDQDERPELVLCSSATRTRETLERIEPALGDGAEVRIEPRVYEASADELLDLVRELPAEVDAALLIGHNPGIEDLTASLARPGQALDRARDKFPTAALATLEFDAAWDRLAPGAAQLVAFVRPRELED
jgi:phosphohistidine phosphatase